MNIAVVGPTETLTTLIDRASAALDSARTSAEVLEAREYARVAYDAAKSAARIATAKRAHDSLIAEAHRVQANATFMRARAEMRLAEEYDAAQGRGEVKTRADNQHASSGREEAASAHDLGLSHKDIHEARKLRDAEASEPGLISRALDAMVARGEEPTRAALKREVFDKPKPKQMDPKALWVWGRLKDFEREGILSSDPDHLLREMTDPMRADVRRLLPLVRGFIEDMEVSA